ncbi:MAG: hypothetical protein KME02_12905 [Aphanothece saxicola GSE-SYN-MK-01-06B]|jgi:hypothetical protein|nr:hypothetical protein [Aphanothece saxicola GSE-SYN-MK-01-06B]
MSASQTKLKAPEANDGSGELLALGLRVADSGLHASKTLMFQELEALLAAVPADASAKDYRTAIVDENALGSPTISARKETGSRLNGQHGLDPNKLLFRVLQRVWGVDPAAPPQLALHSQLACARSCVWDLPAASAMTPINEEERQDGEP